MAIQGILKAPQLSSETVTVLDAYLREVFINECPLITRLDRVPIGALSYNIVGYDVRQRAQTLTAAFTATSSDTTLTLADTSGLMNGDVLEVKDTGGTNVERVMVSGDPVTATTVLVKRGVEGTTPLANTSSGGGTTTAVTLIGNSRFDGMIDQNATRAARYQIPQNVQTFTFPVQVGRLANMITNVALPSGISNIFSLEQKTKMTEMMRDIENTSYSGLGDAPSATITGKQSGLRRLISYYNGGATPAAGSNANIKSNPGSSYTFLGFVSDGIQKVIDAGGQPNVCLCSTSMLTALETWGYGKLQINDARNNQLGMPINEITYPFTSGPMTFIPSYQLPKGTAVIMTWDDIKMRYMAPESWLPRSTRGQAQEGEWFADMCIELGHPGWHAVIENMTTFA